MRLNVRDLFQTMHSVSIRQFTDEMYAVDQ